MIETMGTAKRPGGARGSVLLAALLLGISAACAAAGLSLPPGDPGRAPDLAGMRDPIPRPRSLDGPSDGARGTLLGKTMEPLASQEEERSREEARASLGEPEEDRAARISPVVAFLMSAALPGSGQLVEGRNRAFAYLGVEVLSWVSHFAWKDAALRKEGEYEAYADRHWDLEAWSDAALEDCPAGAIPPGGNYAELYETIQRLRVEDTNDYYELLAKEDGYRAGWDDFSCPS
ncbi:MAG: hypothetical protein FJY88_11195, partial [Candidatus Eisenbacteria bacterium]|nr:hypothetical protein [Candidatus Eisenbacteria bacterium]